MKVLEGIRVLDFTQALSGVFCSQYLGDFGADVIKVERPVYGDQSRCWGPFRNDLSAYYVTFNRNKRGLAINLRDKSARDIILQLVERSDIVLENFKVGTLEKLGLGYEDMIKVNPKLIYGSISGFGTDGPLAQRPCYDIVAGAMSGVHNRSGVESGPPIKPGFSLCDNLSGINLLNAIAMALIERENTNQSVRVDISMLDSAFYLMANQVMEQSCFGTISPRTGNQDPFMAPYGLFRTSDGLISICAAYEQEWQKLCSILSLDALLTDERFANAALRAKNIDALVSGIEAVTSQQTKHDLETLLTSGGIAAGAVNTIEEVVHLQQCWDREILVELEQKQLGKYLSYGSPMKLQKTPCDVHGQAPLLGEHSVQILAEIGYSEQEIEQLLTGKVIAQ